MKNYVRTLALILSLFMCVSYLCACHGVNVKDTPASAEAVTEPFVAKFDTDKNYELTFWAKNDTNKTQAAIYEKAINDFEKLYPNIKVSLRLYTDYGKIYNDVITNIATNTTPNVCITYPDHVATYLSGQDIVVPLADYMSDSEYGFGGSKVLFDAPSIDEIVPEFLSECMFSDGEYYALPYMRSTEALYVNKTYVEKLGYTLPEDITWDFIWEVSEAALAKNDDGTYVLNGTNTIIPFIYKSTDNMMIQMLYQKGARYTNALGDIFLFNDTTREFLLEIAKHGKSRAFSTFKISSYPANFLNRGECVFAVDSTAGSTWMGSDAPLSDISEDSIVDFETAVYKIPQFDARNPKMISQGPSMCIFNKEDKGEVLASWLFTMYLLTNDVQIAYAETEGYVPVTLKAQNSDEYLDYLSREGEDNEQYYDIKLKATKLLLENVSNTFVTPVFNGSASVRDAAGQLIEEVTKSVRRKEEVDNAYIDALYDKVISLYDLDRNKVFFDDTLGSPEEQTGSLPELGPLPFESAVLLWTFVSIWVVLGAYFLVSHTKKSKK